MATVLESSHNELRSSSLNINIFSNNTGVVAAKLESNTLEGLAASSHDLLSSNGAAGETDLRNARVLGEHGTKLVITTKNLNDAGREDGLSQLNCLQRCVGSERRGFDDDGATSKESGTDLAERENQRELRKDCQCCLETCKQRSRTFQGQMAPTTPRGVYLVVMIFSSSSIFSSGMSKET